MPADQPQHDSDEGFPKQVRLLRQSEFDAVYQGDAYAADQVLVIRGIANGTKETRLGLSISKKVGNAVVRNKWKRRIREAFRKQKSEFAGGLDIVVRPKRGAACDYHAIFESLNRLTNRIAKRLAKDQRQQRNLDLINAREQASQSEGNN